MQVHGSRRRQCLGFRPVRPQRVEHETDQPPGRRPRDLRRVRDQTAVRQEHQEDVVDGDVGAQPSRLLRPPDELGEPGQGSVALPADGNRRYSVAAPTPARRATVVIGTSRPRSANSVRATSRIRSRLRRASARSGGIRETSALISLTSAEVESLVHLPALDRT